MNVSKLFLAIFLILCCAYATAQNEKNLYTDGIYKDNIRTVRCYAGQYSIDYPIVELASGRLTLAFDDMDADVKDYYYTITHCNADWTPSILSTMEYIDGFETEEILDYEYSFGTLVDYTHYRLTLPNDNMSFTKSGNYILKVFLDNDQEDIVLTRRFMVVDSQISIKFDLVIPNSVRKRRTHHEIDFIINHNSTDIRAPREDIKVVVMQNGRWDNAITGLKPIFVRGKELVYDYQDKIVFPAGREYRFVDLSSTRIRGDYVSSLEDDGEMHYMHVMPDKNLQRVAHIFEEADINGKYIISNAHERNDNLEADYITTFFKFVSEEEYPNGSLYLFGELTDWQIKDEFEMSYVPAEGGYMLKTLLKQGIYNYAYAFVEDGTTNIDQSYTDGNWFQTENHYQILVYYSPFGARYDQLINVTAFNSLW